MISEAEAKEIVLQLGTAMLNNDKEAREMVYANLDTDSLKRVIRWAIRHNLHHFVLLTSMQGIDPYEAWKQLTLTMAVNDD